MVTADFRQEKWLRIVARAIKDSHPTNKEPLSHYEESAERIREALQDTSHFDASSVSLILSSHRYDYSRRPRKNDPGYHQCSCGTGEGYWSGFHEHVATEIFTSGLAQNPLLVKENEPLPRTNRGFMATRDSVARYRMLAHMIEDGEGLHADEAEDIIKLIHREIRRAGEDPLADE